MATLKVITKPGTHASKIGDAYGHADGVSWRDSVDHCDSNGCGRVFLDYDSHDIGEWLAGELDADERVDSYEFVDSA